MERVRFFDELADRWDRICDLQRVAASVRAGLAGMGVSPSERMVDIGCGTGTLLQCLLDVLGPGGRIHAVDISSRMIERARAKIHDPRVTFTVTSAEQLPLPDGAIDRVFCFSCWPHIDRPTAVLAEFRRVLRPGGMLHVWHVDGKEIINGIHKNAGAAVASDVLEPGEELANLLSGEGFNVHEVIDTPIEYRVSATMAVVRES